MAIVYLSFGVIAISIIATIIIIVIPTQRHKKENQKLLDCYEAKYSDRHSRLILEHLLMREQTYHRTYFIWQTLSKVSGILGILLSVCSLVIPQDLSPFYSQFFTILSILLVIFALYLLPEHKYRDYLWAYRKCGGLIGKIVTQKIPITDYAYFLNEIENSLSSDVE